MKIDFVRFALEKSPGDVVRRQILTLATKAPLSVCWKREMWPFCAIPQ